MQEGSSVSLLLARDQIVDKAQSVIEINTAARRASRGRSNPYSSLTVLLQQMQREYEDRFLYELIQNAYDAHPPEADGQIALLLDELEGEYGVLYVANGGGAVRSRQLRGDLRACTEQQGARPVDREQGVGFKSVLQVRAWPEIYSRAGSETATFDGFCFGFARPGPLRGTV
jgi:hypothetical protein